MGFFDFLSDYKELKNTERFVYFYLKELIRKSYFFNRNDIEFDSYYYIFTFNDLEKKCDGYLTSKTIKKYLRLLVEKKYFLVKKIKDDVFGIKLNENNEIRVLEKKISLKEQFKFNKESEDFKHWKKFYNIYPGTKSLTNDYKNFRTKYPEQNIDNLILGIEREISFKNTKKLQGEWVAQYKNLSTWINNKCWEQEFETITNSKKII